MVLLTLFALLAGAGTALSPCVLPVLPALLSAGATGGRRRPLGIVIGLSVTFTITIVGVAKVVDGVGLGTGPLRYLAVAVLLGFGVAVLVPAVAAAVEARLSRVGAMGPRTRGDGFLSGLAVGGALGFVYTPCAGPILAAVISVSAATGRTVVIAIAYAVGSATVLLALSLGGRRLVAGVRGAGRGPVLQRTMGAVMIITAAAILSRADVRFDQFIAQHVADINLTTWVEKSHAVSTRLTDLTGGPRFAPAAARPGIRTTSLPVLGNAPEFIDNQRWFNTPGSRPLTMSSLRGRVVLIDFWTYTCINCLRTLPYLKAWDASYRSAGLTIVGVHSPEFSFEHDAGNVSNAISQFAIRYPVAQDNNLATWSAWGNQYWPAEYLVDVHGQVRSAHFGEGDYAKSEASIRALLAEAGAQRLGAGLRARNATTPSPQTTPETYLGSARARGFEGAPPTPGQHRFPGPSHPLSVSRFAYRGAWAIAAESAMAGDGAQLEARVQAKDVYLVAGSPGHPRRLRVLLDGHPVGGAQAGGDVHGATVTVTGQRLYSLVSLPGPQVHDLTLVPDAGLMGYSFTFG